MDIFTSALPALVDAFALILQPQQIMFLVLGVLLGLSVGVFPGLGGIALICFMAGSLHRDFPPGLLQAFVELPWPLGEI